MRRIPWSICTILFAVAIPQFAAAASFTAGDMVVLRIGDGSGALSNSATAVFLDEYTPTGTKVQSIALPTAQSGNNRPLTVAGNSATDGFVRRSADGRYLTMAGYAATPGTAAVAGTTSSATNRVVARIDASGNVDTTTVINSAFSGANIRGAVTNDGTSFWIVGSNSGVQYVAFGSTGASTQINSAIPLNLRVPGIFNGQLYITGATAYVYSVAAVGTGLPTSGGQTPVVLNGLPASGPSPYSFVMIGANTLYIADDRPIASGGGIQKWTNTGGTWTLAKTLNSGLATGVRGLTGSVSGPTVVLYATTTEFTANKLVKVTDDGTASPAFSTLATAPASTAFRGVDLAPAP